MFLRAPAQLLLEFSVTTAALLHTVPRFYLQFIPEAQQGATNCQSQAGFEELSDRPLSQSSSADWSQLEDGGGASGCGRAFWDPGRNGAPGGRWRGHESHSFQQGPSQNALLQPVLRRRVVEF
ncbi:hypothetical protein SKAU_G00043950 [Synaphobranchus kaupii]|uniref:Uncharacterized protein n=1 Tax=Synaphobranchus kaupii TaxID=118154 RepID=A0A9Q1J933_SYNKA|nr:hypothetical protein SKAU_G00043950 [Synaphobranchus kaupii]